MTRQQMNLLDDVGESFSNQMEDYQLIGDSQFLRFSEKLLNFKRQQSNGVFHSGFCVSGQRISDLLCRVQVGFADVSEKVVLMIGTNDLLRGTSFEDMCRNFDELLDLLGRDAKKIIVLTIPPVPKLKDNEDHWDRLKKFNEHIRQCKDGKRIFVADAYAKFIEPKTLPKEKILKGILKNPKRDLSRESTLTPQSKMNSANCSPNSICIWSRKGAVYQKPVRIAKDCDKPRSRRIRSPSPSNREVKSVQKKAHRRSRSSLPERDRKDSQLMPATRRSSLVADRGVASGGPNASYASRVLGGFVRGIRVSESSAGALPRNSADSSLGRSKGRSSKRSTDGSPKHSTGSSSRRSADSAPKRSAGNLSRRSTDSSPRRSSGILVSRSTDSSPRRSSGILAGRSTDSPPRHSTGNLFSHSTGSLSERFTDSSPGRSTGTVSRHSTDDRDLRMSVTRQKKPNSRIRSPKRFPGSKASSLLSQRLAPKKKCETHVLPADRSPDFDVFIHSTAQEKFDSSPYPTSPVASDDTSTPSSRSSPTSNENCGMNLNERFTLLRGDDDSSTTPLNGAITPRRKRNSPFSRTTPTSDGDAESDQARTPRPRTKRNLFPRAKSLHDDSKDEGSTANEVNIEIADPIRDECFEKCFAGDTRRPDLIHLNTKGMCTLQTIILDTIASLEEKQVLA